MRFWSTACWVVLKLTSRSYGHEPDNTHLGVIVGALTERLVRVTGRLRFECSSSSLRPDVGSAHGGPLSMDWTEVTKEMSVQGAQYIFAIDLFNGKEVPTGLRGVRVRLIRDDG